ncbi:MAG: hypothetical protein KI792_12260 [Alphaproteobacteria bacterium]|nr:hypothetical protein [Alphaproteobacteria bacterium SS10]
MSQLIPFPKLLSITITTEDGEARALGTLTLGRGHKLTIHKAEGGADVVLQRICDKYNDVDRISRDAPAPDGNPMESWSEIVGRQDDAFPEALIDKMQRDFGLIVEPVR